MWASLSPSKLSTGPSPPFGFTEVESQTWLAQPRTLLASLRAASGSGGSARPSSIR